MLNFKKTGKQHRFGGEIVKCPVCGEEKRTENTIRLHITNTARGESWNKEFNKKVKTPHLDFYKKYTTIIPRYGRMWTN